MSQSGTIVVLTVLFRALFSWNPDTPREQIRREMGEQLGSLSWYNPRNPSGALRSNDELDWMTDLATTWLRLAPAEQHGVERGDKAIMNRVFGEAIDDDPDDCTIVREAEARC